MNIVLYSTDCPRCKALEMKLNKSGKEFTVVKDFDVEKFVELGIHSAPILEVDGEYMTFEKAIKWMRGEN